MNFSKIVSSAAAKATRSLSQKTRSTWSLRGFGLTKVPLLLYCMPTVEVLTASQCIVRIPLNWRTKNHYRSMYFGALAVGADCAGGLMAMRHIELSGHNVQLLFKDFHAEFLRRPEGDVHFVCNDGKVLQKLVAQAVATGERVNQKIGIDAVVPSMSAEPAAKFTLTISLKKAR